MALFQTMVWTCLHVHICSGAPELISSPDAPWKFILGTGGQNKIGLLVVDAFPNT